MTSAATQLESELTAAFAAAKQVDIKACTHCGINCIGDTVYCRCEELIKRYGAVGCDCCGIQYDFFEDIATYLEATGDAEYLVYQNYLRRMAEYMPTPCEKCTDGYKLEHAYLMECYTTWETVFKKRWEAAKKAKKLAAARLSFYDEDGFYEPPCGSSGGICPCCGECPD